jgi:hypothetical protein
MSVRVLVRAEGAGTSICTFPPVLDGKTLDPPTVNTILIGGLPREDEGDTAELLPGVAVGATA